jgi:putative Mg2+ transporter-C (MgtC) family protein
LILQSETLGAIDIAVRLGLAFLAGGIIGFERSSRRQVAGLRTHILICLGAALLMMLSIWLPRQYNPRAASDPGRIAAQVVSGIGFLGAGAIIRLGNNVRGLTTAASLWLIAAVGLAIGAGMYLPAAGVEALSLITLVVLDRIEKKIFPAVRNKLLELRYKPGSNPDPADAMRIFSDFGIKKQSMDVNQRMGKDKSTKVRFLVSIPDSTNFAGLAKAFKSTGKIARVEIKEKF